MNTIQAALAKIGNLARQKFGDNEGFIQNNKVTFQPIRQAVSSPTNLAYTTSKLFTGNPLTRQQYTQAVQPIAKAYTKLPRGVQKFGEGFYEGTTLGLSDMNVPASTNWGEKLAYGSGYTASMLNPLNPINKIAGALKGTQTVKLLQKPMGQFAGNLIARGGGMKLLGRGIANVAQGIPYTAAYAGVNLLNRKPQDVANDAIQNAAGDLLLGGTPLVGGLLIKSGAGRKMKSAKTVATTATKKLVQEAEDIPSNLLAEARKYKSVDESLEQMQVRADKLKEVYYKTMSGNDLRAWRKLQNEVEDFQLKIEVEKEKVKVAQQKIADEALKKLDSSIDQLTEADNSFLIKEAKKSNTLDEYLQKIRGSSTQYGEYNPRLRKYVRPEAKRLHEITNLKPDDKITVYRGIDNSKGTKINDGDFVTTDYNDAAQYIGPNGRVVSMKVRAKNLINEYPDEKVDNNTFYELIYQSKPEVKITESQLTDIWNKAQGKSVVEAPQPTVPLREIPKEILSQEAEKLGREVSDIENARELAREEYRTTREITDKMDRQALARVKSALIRHIDGNRRGDEVSFSSLPIWNNNRGRVMAAFEQATGSVARDEYEAMNWLKNLPNQTGGVGKYLPEETAKIKLLQQTDKALSQPDKPFVPEMGVLDQDLGIGNPKLKQRGFVTSVKEADFSEKPLKQGVKGVYEPITNKQTMQKAENLIKTDIDTALDKIYNSNEYSAETVALGLKVMAKAQREGNHQIAVNVAETLATKATKAGQSIQALSILSRLTPTGMLRYAVKQINAANENQGIITKGIKRALKVAPAKLSEKSAKRITTLMNLANTATTEEYQSRYTRMAMDEIASKLPYGISDLIDEMRYNNMLSSIGTHLRNGWSNLWQVGVIRPSTLLFQGQPKSVANYYKGVVSAIPQAVDKALIAISGKTPYKPIEMELGRKLRPKPRLGLYNIPTRLLEASDQFFTTMVKSGEIARGATPKDAEKLAENLLFRSGTKLENQGALLNKIDDLTIGVENLRKVGLGWFIPFIRTPMNVAKQWIEYSPAGVLTLPGAKNKKEQLAKAMVGSVVTLIGAKAAMEGRTTWAAPTDPTEKKLFYDSGRKPYSVKVGNKWVPMQYLGSTAWAFGIPAAVKYYQDDQRQALTDDQVNKLTSALLSLGGFWSQQTFVSGLGSFVNVAQGKDDYTLSKSLAYTGSQIIPFSSLQRYIANIIDPVFRKPKDVVQQVKSGIPFMTQDLPYYETSTGEPAKRNITNYIAPYAMGYENKQFEQPYQERKQRIQENALINAVKNSPSQYTPQDITRTQTIESQRAVQEDMDRYAKRIDTYLALPSDNKTRTSKIKRVKTEIINNDTLPEQTKQELLKKLPEIKEEVKTPKKAKAKKVKKAKIKKVKKAKLQAKIKKPKVVKAKKIKVAKVKKIKMPKLAVRRVKTQRRAYA